MECVECGVLVCYIMHDVESYVKCGGVELW